MNHKIIRTTLALLFVALLITAPRAQQLAPVATKQSSEDRVALYQALLDLTNPWTVMCIAAHPDDEDGTSLIVMRRKYGAHTVSLFSTFGEGGQNAIGPELYEELGAIRARETMAAAEIQGSEPHFLGLKDFGYSKSPDEAFKFWGHDEALRRMVLEIRKLRPDVIITNHSVTSNDHGHHQATARLELEAFDAAADPKRFPEQLKDGVTIWQVQRLFVRMRGNQAVQNPDRQGGGDQFVTIDPNEKDPVRGVVYAEEALRALQQHATQGPWPKTFVEYANRFRAFSGQQGGAPGQLPLIRYMLVREAKGTMPLSVKDSHNFIEGLQLPDDLAKQLQPPTIDGKPLTDFADAPNRVLDVLNEARGHGLFNPIKNEYVPRSLLMRIRLETALASATGIKAELMPRNGDAVVASEDHRLMLLISNEGTRTVEVLSADFRQSVNHEITVQMPVLIEPGKSARVPIAELDRLSPLLDLIAPRELTPFMIHSVAMPRIVLNAMVGEHARIAIPISSLVKLLPALEIKSVEPRRFAITPATADRPAVFHVRLANHLSKPYEGELSAGIPQQSCATNMCPNLQVAAVKVKLAAGETKVIDINVPLKSSYEPTTFGSQFGQASFGSIKAPYMLNFGAPQFDNYGFTRPNLVPISLANARIAANLHVGYLRGFDDSLLTGLLSLGVTANELTVDEVKTADLSKYTSIIVDNRVYESKPELIAVNQKLLDYANAGGTLIVFYHKSDEWNPDPRRNRPQLAPYKLILGNERITDENAPITFIEPGHPLLNTPNKMGQEDFANWIQERGLYYPREWDPQFHALLQSNDPGEAPLKGGLLVADYGRGHYIYTSMVWYRELRAGVPGAYRMLANMISYGRTGK
jgi:LmbE family N-acetylglucosaminyl deacetylase